jgi:hypothetical protein
MWICSRKNWLRVGQEFVFDGQGSFDRHNVQRMTPSSTTSRLSPSYLRPFDGEPWLINIHIHHIYLSADVKQIGINSSACEPFPHF